MAEPALYGRMEIRIRDAEKQMAKLQQTVDRNLGGMERRTQQAARRIDANFAGAFKSGFSGLATGAAAALAPVLSISAALAGAKAAMDEFGKTSDQAKAAALDAETFQAYAYAASQGGVAVDEFSKALAGFAKNAGLASEGKGRMVAALKALNPELLANIQAATSQEQRIRLVADAMDREQDSSRKAALATAAFGDAGARMVEVLRGGSVALEATAQKARQLGIVVDRDLIDNAEELGDRFETATKIISVNFQKALVDLAPTMVWIAEKAATLAKGIRDLHDAFSLLENRSSEALKSELADLGKQRLDNENQMIRIRGGEAPADGIFGTSFGASTPGEMLQELERANEALAVQEQRILAILDSRQKLATVPPPPGINPNEAGGVGGGSRPAPSRDAVDAWEGLRKVTVDYTSAQDAANEKAREFNDIAINAGDALASALADGKLELQEILPILQDVIAQLLRMGALGPLFSAFSGGFNPTSGGFANMLGLPGRASGGPVTAGQPYVVGEKRPELFVPRQSGTIIPRVPSIPNIGGVGREAPTMNFSPSFVVNVSGDGDPSKIGLEVRKQIDQFKREFPQMTAKALKTIKVMGYGT